MCDSDPVRARLAKGRRLQISTAPEAGRNQLPYSGVVEVERAGRSKLRNFG